jgi:hypothetical protein
LQRDEILVTARTPTPRLQPIEDFLRARTSAGYELISDCHPLLFTGHELLLEKACKEQNGEKENF